MQDLLENVMEEKNASFAPRLKLLDATLLVAGSMIGSGIFIVSADIVRNVGSAGWLLLVWVITAIMTWSAAISYGELSAMFPNAGGQYVYIKEAFGKLMGFLYGWTLFTVIQTGTIAAVGVAFAKFAAYFFPILELDGKHTLLKIAFTENAVINFQPAHLLSIVLVVLLTAINARSMESGKIIQRIFTISKIAALLFVIIIGVVLGSNAEVWQQNWQNAFLLQPLSTIEWNGGWVAQCGLVAVAMVGSVFSADAWNNITFVAGEVVNPKKNIGLSLLLGTGIVLLLYILCNAMYLSVLPLQEIANAPSDRVAVAVCQKILGDSGTKILAVLIMISTFGCINGMILSGARVYYVMAKDKLFFASAAKLNARAIPSTALWWQCAWICLLCVSGKYGDLLDYVVMAVLIFYIVTILAIFKLRATRPLAERPYKVLGYPIIPIAYITLASAMSLLLLKYKPAFTLPGLGIVCLGIPVYFFLQKRWNN